MKTVKAILSTIATVTLIPFLSGMFGEAGKKIASVPPQVTADESNDNKETDSINENDNEVSNIDGSIDEEYIPTIKLIEKDKFNLENEYTIYAGKFNNQEGLNKRLEEVQSKYEFATSVGDRIVLERGIGISADDIYNKCLQYHNGLLGVISDTIKDNEKWTAPTIKNKYIQDEIEAIEKYALKSEYDKCQKSIEATIEVINTNSYDELKLNGYINYKLVIKDIINKNSVLKLKVEDIYNRL